MRRRACCRNSFHHNRYSQRIGFDHLNQRIAHKGVTPEGRVIHRARYVDRIGSGSLDRFDMFLGTTNRDRFRHCDDPTQLITGSRRADHSRLHRDAPRDALVKLQMKLAGDNLNHFDSCGLLNILRREIENVLSRVNCGDTHFRVYVGRTEAVNEPLRAAQPDVCLINVG